ncbi:MAG: hypothetical protein EZS28_052886, partial [Streblomastix strix]
IDEVPQSTGSKKKLKAPNFKQWVVIIVTLITIVMWFILPYTNGILGNEAIVGLIPFVVFFGFNLCKRSEIEKLPWSMILLIFGGSALGESIRTSHLLEMIADIFSGGFVNWALWVKAILLVAVVEFVAIIVSHTVSALVLLPIISQIMIVAGGHVNMI